MAKNSMARNALFVFCFWGAVAILFCFLCTLVNYIKPTELLTKLLTSVLGGV